MPEVLTHMITKFGGSYVTWAECEVCQRPVQYPTERPFRWCPYCGSRIDYREVEKNGK